MKKRILTMFLLGLMAAASQTATCVMFKKLIPWNTKTENPLFKEAIQTINEDNIEAFRLLLKGNIDINAVDAKDGVTLLHIAALHKSPLFAHELIELGANLEAKDSHGRTPLHYVAGEICGCQDVARILIGNGAHVNARDNNGKTPLYHNQKPEIKMPFPKNTKVEQILIDNGATL